MKIVSRHTLYRLEPGVNGGKPTGTVNGRPYNWSVPVNVWRKRGKLRTGGVPAAGEEFFWTTHRGNDRRKFLRGPFPTEAAALAAAKTELGLFDGTEHRTPTESPTEERP